MPSNHLILCCPLLLTSIFPSIRVFSSVLVLRKQKLLKSTYSEGLMLKLKLQYFGHLMRRTDPLERTWCWQRLKAEEEGDDRGWDGWMASLTRWTWVWVSSRSWWWTGKPGVLQSMGLQRVRHDWATELNWKMSVGEKKHWTLGYRVRGYIAFGLLSSILKMCISFDPAIQLL